MWIKLGLLLVFLVAVIGLYASGAYALIDAERLQGWIRGAGVWGGAAFVLSYAILQPLGVRSVFFLMTAPLIWSPATAFFLSWIGAIGPRSSRSVLRASSRVSGRKGERPGAFETSTTSSLKMACAR